MSLAEYLRSKQTSSSREVVWVPSPVLLCLPQIPKPMHGLAPRVILGRDWWDTTRREAYRLTDHHCLACGVHQYRAKGEHQWLEGHEVYDIDYLLGRMTYLVTVPLCPYCHAYIHCGRLQALLDKGEISQLVHDGICAHGAEVLARAGLCKPLPYTGPCADWEDWRLVLNGREYPPLYPTYLDWVAAYGPRAV